MECVEKQESSFLSPERNISYAILLFLLMKYGYGAKRMTWQK